MRILVTNDDGINAPGLEVLYRIALALTEAENVFVVAPETDQSGTSHSLSLNDPLRLRKLGERRFAVKGTPTDCVILGVQTVLGGVVPDLLLSGVNRGQNVAEDVTYSGTIAAAMEGTTLGIKSIALSQSYAPGGDHNKSSEVHWKVAERYGPKVIRHILDVGIEPGILMNVNFPNCTIEEVEGLAATVQGFRGANLLKIEERKDGRGNPYFWLGFARPSFELREGTDLHALRHNRISVTPLKLDLSDMPTVTRLAQSFDTHRLTD